MSPINHGSNKPAASRDIRSQVHFVESTPNQKENTNRQFRDSNRNLPKVANPYCTPKHILTFETPPKKTQNTNSQFLNSNQNIPTNGNQFCTPQRVTTFETSPSKNFMWSLNKKRIEDENERKATEKAKEREALAVFSMTSEELAQSFNMKLQQFAKEHRSHDPEPAAVTVAETVPQPTTKQQPTISSTMQQSPTPSTATDLRTAFLAMQERDNAIELRAEALRKKQQVESAAPTSTLTLEEKLRQYSRWVADGNEDRLCTPVAQRGPRSTVGSARQPQRTAVPKQPIRMTGITSSAKSRSKPLPKK